MSHGFFLSGFTGILLCALGSVVTVSFAKSVTVSFGLNGSSSLVIDSGRKSVKAVKVNVFMSIVMIKRDGFDGGR